MVHYALLNIQMSFSAADVSTTLLVVFALMVFTTERECHIVTNQIVKIKASIVLVLLHSRYKKKNNQQIKRTFNFDAGKG